MPAEIRIFADKLAAAPAEVCPAPAGITLEAWLRQTVPSYQELPAPPISVAIAGAVVPPSEWGRRTLKDGDVVDIVVEPGADPFSITMAVIAIASAAYTLYQLNNLPDAPRELGQASSIYDPNAQGNKPRLLQPIPEVLGRHPVYPDYIAQPFRRYVNDELWLFLNLCITRGACDVHGIEIGNTPIDTYAGDVDYQISGPGEDVSGHAAHRNVYTSPEVGSTAGTAGIELKGQIELVPSAGGSAVTFVGNRIQYAIAQYQDPIYSPDQLAVAQMELVAQPWPWPEGIHFTVNGATSNPARFDGNVSVIDGAGVGAVTFSGNVNIVDGGLDGNDEPLPDQIQSVNGAGLDVFAVGQQVTLSGAGANDGSYFINSVSPAALILEDAFGQPITDLVPMAGVAVTITRAGSPSQPDEIRSHTGAGLGVFTVGERVALSGAGANDGVYTIRSASPGVVTLNDAGNQPVTSLVPMASVGISLRSLADNGGTYRVEAVEGAWATVVRVDSETWEPVPGWSAFEADATLAGVELKVLSDDRHGEWVGPFAACPPGEMTDRLWLSFARREGLASLSKEGDAREQSSTVEIQYRRAGEEAWMGNVIHTRTAATLDELGETVEIELPQTMRPEVRVRRITPRVDSTRWRDKVEWVSLQAQLETPTRYEGVTTLQLSIRGTNALASTAENKLRVDVERHLPRYVEGEWQPAAPTQSIADAALYVLKDAGHTDSQLDLAEFERLRALWALRGDTFCGVFDQPGTVFDAVKQILAVGYAEPVIDWGQITPVRDEPRTAWEHVYTPDVMTGEGVEREIVLWDPNEPDGVEVEYFDPISAKPATVLCLLPGDQGVRPEKIKAFGITDRTRAWRYGMRHRRGLRYRNTKLRWSTELAALNSSYGSYCAVTDGIPGQAQSGRVAAVDGRRLTLDRVPEWGEGVHYLALRGPDGKLVGPFRATPVAGDPYGVTLSGDPGEVYPEDDPTYQIPTQWLFGPAEKWCIPALVRRISPQGEHEVSVEAVRYDARVYADDDNEPPAEVA